MRWFNFISNNVLCNDCSGDCFPQGFVHHDLSRACLAQTQDTIPRIILIGRLALSVPMLRVCTRKWCM